MESTQEYVFRTYGDGSFAVGQVVIPGVTFFSKDNYGLTREEATKKFNQLRGAKRGQS